MYTKYATQFHMAAHLKRANCIQIHDSMMDMAVSLASQVSAVKLEAEMIGGKPVHVLRFAPKPRHTIGYAISKTGVRLNVVDFRHVDGGEHFYIINTMHGERGVKASDYRFEPKVLIFAAIEAQVAA